MSNIQSKLYDHAHYGEPNRVTGFLKWLVASYGLPENPNVLDIGAGTGRMMQEYITLGWQVIGMEPDEAFYHGAVMKFKEMPQITVRQGGFSEIDYENTFDLITSVNDPFSYLTTVSSRVEALQKCYTALKPGGILFLDGPNFLYILKHYRDPLDREIAVEGETVRHVAKHEFDFHGGVWTHIDLFYMDAHRPPVAKTHHLAIISPPELLYFVEQTGFDRIRTFNSYDSRASERWNSPRMILTARKPVSTN